MTTPARRETPRFFPASALALSCALLLAACGGGGGDGDTTPDTGDVTKRIYVLSADAGQAGAVAAGQTLSVTLTGVEPGVDWYSDRPAREVGEARVENFVGADWQRVYSGVAPNALLQFQNASGVHAVFGSVQAAQYDGAARTLRLELRVAKVSPGTGTCVSRKRGRLCSNTTKPSSSSMP